MFNKTGLRDPISAIFHPHLAFLVPFSSRNVQINSRFIFVFQIFQRDELLCSVSILMKPFQLHPGILQGRHVTDAT